MPAALLITILLLFVLFTISYIIKAHNKRKIQARNRLRERSSRYSAQEDR